MTETPINRPGERPNIFVNLACLLAPLTCSASAYLGSFCVVWLWFMTFSLFVAAVVVAAVERWLSLKPRKVLTPKQREAVCSFIVGFLLWTVIAYVYLQLGRAELMMAQLLDHPA